jgi:predicted ArsR family transcriptional regulator
MDAVTQDRRSAAWQYIKSHAQFTVPELASAIGMDLEQCRTSVNQWRKQGYIRHIGGPGVPGRPKRFARVDGSGEPRVGKGNNEGMPLRNQRSKTGRQKMWNSMKISRSFTASDLTLTGGICRKSADEFIRKLLDAGYLSAVHRVDTSKSNREIQGQISSYRLIRDTGRLAPMVRKQGCWDQNQQRLYPFNNHKQQDEEARHDQDVA